MTRSPQSSKAKTIIFEQCLCHLKLFYESVDDTRPYIVDATDS